MLSGQNSLGSRLGQMLRKSKKMFAARWRQILEKNHCSRRLFESTALFTYHYNMIVCFHLVTFLANEYFTPEWQRHVRDITREVFECMTHV